MFFLSAMHCCALKLQIRVFPEVPASGIFAEGKIRFFDSTAKNTITLYGQASFYAAKFHGRRTASGETFSHAKFTAACNMLPLGTWVKVTNLMNGKSIVVKTNDRLHNKTTRLLDLTKTGATALGFVKAGLTRVKIEVIGIDLKE